MSVHQLFHCPSTNAKHVPIRLKKKKAGKVGYGGEGK